MDSRFGDRNLLWVVLDFFGFLHGKYFELFNFVEKFFNYPEVILPNRIEHLQLYLDHGN